MPRGPIPERLYDLLTGTALGHLATVGDDGHPQVNPVWFIWEDGSLLIGVKGETGKLRNLRRHPWLALSILDPANPFRYLEIRGEVIAFDEYRDLSFVNRLSQKYRGTDYDPAEYGKERYRLTVRVDAWTSQA
jgi:PPOX class probable F420-dependent enzyme